MDGESCAMASSDPTWAPIAHELHQFHIERLPHDFIASYSPQHCLDTFRREYRSIELFDSGQRASVYKITRNDGKTFLMKSIRLRKLEFPWIRAYYRVVGLQPLDEIKVAKAVTEFSQQFPSLPFYMRAIDWFQCSSDLIANAFKEDVAAAKKKKKVQIDTFFLIMEEIPASNLYRSMIRLLEENALTVDFIRSVLFQVFFSLDVAEQQLQFSHNDAHVRNILLTDNVNAKTCRKAAAAHQARPGYWQFEIGAKDNQTESNVMYYVPAKDSCGAHSVWIDYGTAAVTDKAQGLKDFKRAQRRLERDGNEGRRKNSVFGHAPGVVGPAFCGKFDRVARETLNMRLTFISLCNSIPKWFYRHWKSTEHRSYQQFKAVLYKLFAMDHMSWWRRHFSWRGQFLGHKTPKSFGLPDRYWRNAKKRDALWYRKIAGPYLWQSLVSQSLHRKAVSVNEVMRMPFFREAYDPIHVPRDGYTIKAQMPVNSSWVKSMGSVDPQAKGEAWLAQWRGHAERRRKRDEKKPRSSYYANIVHQYGR